MSFLSIELGRGARKEEVNERVENRKTREAFEAFPGCEFNASADLVIRPTEP